MYRGRFIERLKSNRFLREFFEPEAFAKFKRYVLTGLMSFAIEYTLFYLLFNFAHLKDMYAHTLALSVTFWFNFIINRIWSFKSKANLKKQLLQYFTLYLINLAITNALLYLLSHVLSLNPNFSKILVMGAVVCWNFILYKKVIYRE